MYPEIASVSVKYRRTEQRKETGCRGARQPVIYTDFVYWGSKAGRLQQGCHEEGFPKGIRSMEKAAGRWPWRSPQ